MPRAGRPVGVHSETRNRSPHPVKNALRAIATSTQATARRRRASFIHSCSLAPSGQVLQDGEGMVSDVMMMCVMFLAHEFCVFFFMSC